MKNKELIANFYESFGKLDAQGMIDYYHDQIEFEDPIFGKLNSKKVRSMWRLLLSKDSDMKVSYCDVKTQGNLGYAKWKATYFYGSKKRKITNECKASFEFKDGKIIRHTDTYSLWRWSHQAFGFVGLLLGWTSFFKNKITNKAQKALLDFETKKK